MVVGKAQRKCVSSTTRRIRTGSLHLILDHSVTNLEITRGDDENLTWQRVFPHSLQPSTRSAQYHDRCPAIGERARHIALNDSNKGLLAPWPRFNIGANQPHWSSASPVASWKWRRCYGWFRSSRPGQQSIYWEALQHTETHRFLTPWVNISIGPPILMIFPLYPTTSHPIALHATAFPPTVFWWARGPPAAAVSGSVFILLCASLRHPDLATLPLRLPTGNTSSTGSSPRFYLPTFVFGF
jgi:hypothetical protein